MNKRFHTDTRISENFTLKGLQSLTGQEKSNWLKYLAKEIIDNSLEACDRPEIEIVASLFTDASVGLIDQIDKLSIKDNGPGIDEETVHKIFGDVERFGGTKRHYKLLTRGNQGNALMTVLGIQNLLDGALQVQSNSDLYTIQVVENDLLGTPEVEIQEMKADEDVSGLRVDIDLTNNEDYFIGNVDDIKEVYHQFVELNPHTDLRLMIEKEGEVVTNYSFLGNGDGDNKLSLGKNNTTGKVIWFSREEFYNRLKADGRIAPEISLRDFVQEFYGFSSPKKASEVLDEFNRTRDIKIIGDFFDSNGQLDKSSASWLYEIMRERTNRFSEKRLNHTLGSIGEEGLKYALIESLKLSGQYESVEEIVEASIERGLRIQDIDDLIVYYAKGGISETDKVVPYYFELIAIPRSKEKKVYRWGDRVFLTFGINQSFIYSVPEIHLNFKRRSNADKETYSSIKQAFYSFDYDFKVICNLMCPTVDFQDKGKQLFDTSPFAEAINEVVGKAVRKITNDIMPVLNKLNEDDEENEDEPELWDKAPKGFIKNFIFDNFMTVYNKATNDGRFTITQRQFYYAMRPVFLDTIESLGYKYTWDSSYHKKKKLELEYRTFCSYIDDYEVNVLEKRIIYKKDRGFFVEPHSDYHINLGTEAVRRYYPDLKQYNNLLFVEKSGFYELLHKDFELTKRYDIGLINSEGYANNATRDLIQKIQQAKPDIKLYVLTDFDIDGLGIAKNVKEADELSAVDLFDCERLGLMLEDIEKYDLSIEPVDYSDSKLTELDNRYVGGEISDEVYDFLKAGQRVEINAFTPVELKEYLEDKFEEFGIEKLKPESEEDVETFEVEDVDRIRIDAVKNAIGEYVVEQCGEDLFVFLQDMIYLGDEAKEAEEELKILTEEQAKTIYDEIIERLRGYPPRSWYDINEEVIDRLRSEADNIEGKYKRVVIERAQELLEDRVSIEVEIK